jgi:hypothetical protein
MADPGPPDDVRSSPHAASRATRGAEQERAQREAEMHRHQVLDRALSRLSLDELRYEAGRLAAESRLADDPEQRASLAERAFDLAQFAERADRLSADMAPAASVSANENVNRLLERVRQWRMRAEEYRTVADALQHATARESYLHLALAYETLAEQFEVRAHTQHFLRNLRQP